MAELLAGASSMIRITAAVLLIFSVWTLSALAQVGKMYPVDEAASDPEFFAFRTRLLVALNRRDATFVYGILADDILNSFGDSGGIEEFKTKWKPEDPSSDLWATLGQVLALGGQFQTPSPRWSGYGSKMFVAPYVAAATLPGTDPDPYVLGVVIGSGVRVRQRPSLTSDVVATLLFDVMRVRDWRPIPDAESGVGRSWIAVQLADGRPGYVASEFIRSPIAYRATFILSEGRWLLKILVAGD